MRGEQNAAVHKAAGVGATGDAGNRDLRQRAARWSASINGTVLAGYDKSAVVSAGKLKSTDGVYGLRFAHNTEVTVSGFSSSKN